MTKFLREFNQIFFQHFAENGFSNGVSWIWRYFSSNKVRIPIVFRHLFQVQLLVSLSVWLLSFFKALQLPLVFPVFPLRTQDTAAGHSKDFQVVGDEADSPKERNRQRFKGMPLEQARREKKAIEHQEYEQVFVKFCFFPHAPLGLIVNIRFLVHIVGLIDF